MRNQIFAFAAVLALIGFVQAQPASAPRPKPKPTRIALIDMAEIFRKSVEFIDEREVLKNEVRASDATARAKMALIQALKAELNVRRAGTPEAKKAAELLAKATTAYKKFRLEQQKLFAGKESTIYKEIYLKVQKQTEQTAANLGYTIVFRYNRQGVREAKDPKTVISRMNRLVVVHDESADITDAVLKELNERYKAGK